MVCSDTLVGGVMVCRDELAKGFPRDTRWDERRDGVWAVN